MGADLQHPLPARGARGDRWLRRVPAAGGGGGHGPRAARPRARRPLRGGARRADLPLRRAGDAARADAGGAALGAPAVRRARAPGGPRRAPGLRHVLEARARAPARGGGGRDARGHRPGAPPPGAARGGGRRGRAVGAGRRAALRPRPAGRRAVGERAARTVRARRRRVHRAGPGQRPLSHPAALAVRVRLLNPVFWPEVRRGSERFARELADGLRDRGHDVTLQTSRRGRRTVAVEDGVTVVRVPRLPGEDRLRRRLYEDHLLHLPAAYRELAADPPDVAHALYPTDALAALRARDRRGGAPVVLSYMGIPHRVGLANRRGRKEIVLRAARESDAVVALSRTAADGFERWLGVRAHVVAPGVDVTAFAPGEGRAPVPTILCAADHTQPRKRVALLAEAFALVRRERPDARLVLSRVPGAPLAGRLPDGVEERDLDDRAVLAAANREAWVAALPSVGEAFGLVLAEALACGTPVVGTAAGAIPEVVDRDGIGALFDGDDPRELAVALRTALDLAADPATAARCRERALELSTDRTTEAYLALYADLTARR
ncbi:glycosyltransferase [Conexibacter sp. W3-3-2]|nr:glycosyltransferase [Conexibacter sp. W3-3-2]